MDEHLTATAFPSTPPASIASISESVNAVLVPGSTLAIKC